MTAEAALRRGGCGRTKYGALHDEGERHESTDESAEIPGWGGGFDGRVYDCAQPRAGRGGQRRPEREDHLRLYRLRHAGIAGDDGSARHAGGADRRSVRSGEGRRQLRGLVARRAAAGDRPGAGQARLAEGGTAFRVGGMSPRRSSSSTMPRSGPRASSRAAPRMSISASCWRRRRGSTRSRS